MYLDRWILTDASRQLDVCVKDSRVGDEHIDALARESSPVSEHIVYTHNTQHTHMVHHLKLHKRTPPNVPKASIESARELVEAIKAPRRI
jgi:hypothetical protein